MVIGQLKGVEEDRIGVIIRIQWVRARRTRRNVAASCTCENLYSFLKFVDPSIGGAK